MADGFGNDERSELCVPWNPGGDQCDEPDQYYDQQCPRAQERTGNDAGDRDVGFSAYEDAAARRPVLYGRYTGNLGRAWKSCRIPGIPVCEKARNV